MQNLGRYRNHETTNERGIHKLFSSYSDHSLQHSGYSSPIRSPQPPGRSNNFSKNPTVSFLHFLQYFSTVSLSPVLQYLLLSLRSSLRVEATVLAGTRVEAGGGGVFGGDERRCAQRWGRADRWLANATTHVRARVRTETCNEGGGMVDWCLMAYPRCYWFATERQVTTTDWSRNLACL